MSSTDIRYRMKLLILYKSRFTHSRITWYSNLLDEPLCVKDIANIKNLFSMLQESGLLI